jgi:hypothetical protein
MPHTALMSVITICLYCFLELGCRKNLFLYQSKGELFYKCHVCKLEDDGINDEHFKFSISTVTINTAKVGMKRFVSSWSVPGKGIPNVLSQERSNIRAFWLLLSYCYIV